MQIVQQLIAEIMPHQIYVAADLADPHGTHRKCTDVVLAAIQEEMMSGGGWLDELQGMDVPRCLGRMGHR